MATKYADFAADALALIKEYGAPVTFTRTTKGPHDASTGTFSPPIITTISGQALAIPADPERYRQLGLVLSGSITLLFAPNITGQQVKPGDSVPWGGVGYVVKADEPLAPDGTAIISNVYASR